ncbi:MAG: NfeD family protein [Sulfurovum sp.]|nr:MAG: NfeD family protein [Sulfurovum sp.]
MLAMLNETVIWWHWIAFGLILLILEVNTGTFILLGLGIAAISVGIIEYLHPITFTYQVLIWTALSAGYLLAWKKWINEKHVSETGQSNYNLDMLGTVTEAIRPHHKGKVHFDIPVLGQTEWIAIADEPIAKGERVKIIEIIGQLIKVEKI